MSILRTAALAATFAIPGLAGDAQALTLRQAVERPPAEYSSGPTQSGRTYALELPSAAAVDFLCRLGLGPPPRRGSAWWGCYRPDMDAVIVPARGAWREAERRAIVAHEWAHARGWRHNADGRGTSAASLAPESGRRLPALSLASSAGAP